MPSLSTSFLRALTSPESLVSDSDKFGSSHVAASAAMALATVRRACELRGESIRGQRIIVRGAGTRGLAATRTLRGALQESGLTAREAAACVLVVDDYGLVLENQQNPPELRRFAAPVEAVAGWSFKRKRPSLLETIANSGATVLIGLSGMAGAFSREVVRAVCANHARPIVLPFSWPEDGREATMAEIEVWSSGAAITLGPEKGPNGQGGVEGWTLPGLTLAAIIAEAEIIDESMVMAAARAFHAQTAHQPDRLAPEAAKLRETTERIAIEVVRAAMRSGAASSPELSFIGLEDYVRERLRSRERDAQKRTDKRRNTGRSE